MLELPAEMWRRVKTGPIWKSLFRHGYPDSRKNQSLAVFTNVFLHLHPVKVRRHALAIPYTWCMGGLSFFLFLVLTLTGTLLMFYYRPTTDLAYTDIKDLETVVVFGPREFNWVVGTLLFVLTLVLSYTGYLLPWDQLAFWAVTVGYNIAQAAPLIGNEFAFVLFGGYQLGANALLRFYVLHVVALPLTTAFLIAIHFWRIRKDGGISGPL
jgi:quinol-cytochrome oxidoreductase complex cytochrome b subunit